MSYSGTVSAQNGLATTESGTSVILAGVGGDWRVVNLLGKTATTDARDWNQIVYGSSAQHAACVLQPLQSFGYLIDFALYWTIGETEPLTSPVIRAFGRIPGTPDVAENGNSFVSQYNASLLATNTAIANLHGMWTPLRNYDTDTFTATLSRTALMGDFDANAWFIGEPTRFLRDGCDRVLVTIDTAGTTTTGTTDLCVVMRQKA